MTTDLKARLRRYGATLDNVTSTHPATDPRAANVADLELSNTGGRRSGRTTSLIAAAGLVAAASVAFVATIAQRDTPTPTSAPASQAGPARTTLAPVGATIPDAEAECQPAPPATAPPTIVPLDGTPRDPLGNPTTDAELASDPATFPTAPPTTANMTPTDVMSDAGLPATPPPLATATTIDFDDRSVVHVEFPPPLIPQKDLELLRIDACPRYVLSSAGMRLFVVTPDDTRTGVIVTAGDGYIAGWFDNAIIAGGFANIYRPEAPTFVAGVVPDDVVSIIVDGVEVPIVERAWLAVPSSTDASYTVVRSDGTTQKVELSTGQPQATTVPGSEPPSDE